MGPRTPDSQLSSISPDMHVRSPPTMARKTPCPPGPKSFPLALALRPTQFPEPVATSAIPTAGQAQTETDGGPCLDGRENQIKLPGDFCPDPGQSSWVSPGPGSKAGTEQRACGPPEGPVLLTGIRTASSPTGAPCVCHQTPEGSWPTWGLEAALHLPAQHWTLV